MSQRSDVARRQGAVIRELSRFFVILLLTAFIITSCLMLFVTLMQRTMGTDFTAEDISSAAKATMLNVIILSVAFWLVDLLRRRLTVERPVRRITEATEKMIAGDLSVRIRPTSRLSGDDTFNEIISCINKMAEELSGVETLRTDFIANVSHEMKTPLSVIQSYGTLLQAPELDDESRLEYARAVTAAARRLADMITNILKLNRLENQQIYPTRTVYDLGEQLCECFLQYEELWESRGIDIETDIAENVTVEGDRELLSLVWSNLLSNAFKFTESGGTVALSLTDEDGFAVVRVRDTGCGMSPEVGAHIFEKFYQGDSSHATQGNGLGLALVKRVIDILGCDISVDSELGVGTVFTVRLGRKNEQ